MKHLNSIEDRKCTPALKCTDQRRRIKSRYIVAVLVFFGLFNAFAMQANLSVVSVAMVKHTVITSQLYFNGTCSSNYDQIVNDTGMVTDMEDEGGGQFDWDEYTLGIILGSFFFGFFASNLVGGRVTELIGVKMAFGGGVLVTSFLTLLTPLSANWSYIALIVVRIMEGISQGAIYPSVNFLTARWFHKHERGLMLSLMYSGVNVGVVTTTAVSGYLCSTNFLGGWPSSFYIFGCLGIIWCVLWQLCMHEPQEVCPWMEDEELIYLREDKQFEKSHKQDLPWISILISLPLWSCALVYFSENWGTNLLLYDEPTFLENILGFKIEQVGVICSLTPMMQSVGAIASGMILDWLAGRTSLSDSDLRKGLIAIGSLVPAAALLAVTLSGCNRAAAVSLLLVSSGFSGCLITGVNLSLVNMAPEFSGTLTGVCNGLGEIAGFLAPYVVGFVTEGNDTFDQWYKVFYIAAVIYVIPCAFFIFFGNSELQSWSKKVK